MMDSIFVPTFHAEPGVYPYDALIPGHESITGAYYEVRRLDYSNEFQRLDKYYEEFEPFDQDMKIPIKTINNCRFIFGHAAATFEMKVIGYPAGIADALLSHMRHSSCWQLAFIVWKKGLP